MRVLVTGAAGRIGSEVCRALARHGHEVVATDMKSRDDLPVKVHAINLLDRTAVSALAVNLDACVHLGNHPDFNRPDPQGIFGENMMMNINVMQAAHDGGAKKIIFASSIQVIEWAAIGEEKRRVLPQYLPLDGNDPPRPANPYALSKLCGEEMLRYYTRVFGTQTVAIRFPWTLALDQIPNPGDDWQQHWGWMIGAALAYMSTRDAGELAAAIVKSNLPGFRVYQPGSDKNFLRKPAREVIDRYYKSVPLKKLGEELEPAGGLVDLSKIKRDTGWSPQD